MPDSTIGHEFQKEILGRATAERAVSHAYLFAGPDGVGKKLIALEFAGLLNCTEGRTVLGHCGCASCSKTERGIHPDVALVEFKGAKNIKVDQVREEVEERLVLRPFEGKVKVVIVDEAERLNSNAQNAFLKTLEEPPPNSLIILITSRPGMLLPTIRSRCQTVNFNVLPENLVAGLLEERGFSPEDARLHSRLSSGSPGDALRLDGDIMAWRKELLTELGELDRSSASGITGLAEVLSEASSEDEPGRLELAFRFISLWLRDLALIKIGSRDVTNTDIPDELAAATRKLSLAELLERQRQLEKTWYDIVRANANAKLALESLFLKLAH